MGQALVASHPGGSTLVNTSLRWTLVLNGFDAAFTLLFVGAGLASEANPLMAELIDRSPMTFMLGKIVLVSLCVGLLWRLRHHRSTRSAALLAFIAYSAVMAQHLRILGHMIA